MSDFERIRRIIQYLDEHHIEQPRLTELATMVGLSEFHFHRMFQRWAGITPKDFLQCLTAEHAREQLRRSNDILDTSLSIGLSGPGRLHDLLVTVEAATPGQIKSGGTGMAIEWGEAESPFGKCTIGWNSRGICHMGFHDLTTTSGPPAELLINWPNARFIHNSREAKVRTKTIFQPGTPPQPLKAFVRGTAFQLKVWRALVRIPEGHLVTYGALANGVGAPRSSRSVGTACGNNPIAYLIPCHRVIRETGVVKGYRWGSERKRIMLATESSRGPWRTSTP